MTRQAANIQPTKDILVTGHPRSGTGYMSALMISLGMHVRHERMGKHGTSSWVCAPPKPGMVPYGCSRGDIHFNNLIHVVRHPLKVIASSGYTQFGHGTHRNRMINFMSRFILIHKTDKPIYQATQSYIGWNRLIGSQAPDIRVQAETAYHEIIQYLEEKGFELEVGDPPPNNVNWRKHHQFTSAELKDQIGVELFNALQDSAGEYGYEL